MFWSMIHIEMGRSSNLNLSQFLRLRFITYVLHRSYVLRSVFAMSGLISDDNQFDEDNSAIIIRARKLGRQTYIRKYVSQINR